MLASACAFALWPSSRTPTNMVSSPMVLQLTLIYCGKRTTGYHMHCTMFPNGKLVRVREAGADRA